ncbi:hypothetical protein EC991_004292 [Linnemannia zychae]|nr:hypothetical protein EC991_004292 [Linnemannia zychae]
MASLLHCVVPQLVARSGASTVRQRTMATLSSSSSSSKTSSANAAVKGATGKVSGTSTTAISAAKKSPSTPPQVEADPNPLWILWQEHKGNPWAIGTVVVCALCGDAAVSYALFGRKDKKAEDEVAAATSDNSAVAITAA